MADHTVLAYSSVGGVIVLNVVVKVSLLFPKSVAFSAFSIFVVFSALFLHVHYVFVEHKFGVERQCKYLGEFARQ